MIKMVFRKNNIPWNKDKKYNLISKLRKDKSFEEIFGVEKAKQMREKISKRNKGKHFSPRTEFKKRHVPWNKGKSGYNLKFTKNEIIKRSERLKLLNINPEFKAKAIKGRLKRPTKLEKQFINLIQKYNLPYKYVGDGSFMIERKNPDFININGEKIAIEVYAEIFKKFSFVNIEKWKEDRQEIFSQYGWKLFFFNEKELKNEKEVIMKLR